MQVTIALLPVSLSLVHVPRARLHALSHPILRQILHPHPAFLNITCNEIELSLFAEHHMLRDFEPIARKDRNKQRSRSGSASSRKAPSSQPPPAHEPVEISYDKWSVLQIDSHSDQIDNSGTRVHDLSAPLAAAGISILYQSSYMSDFIFVKESRLQEAMDLFESAGFHLYTSDANPPLSPSYSPVADSPASAEYTPNHHHHQPGAVLTRNISDHDIHKKAVAAAASAEPLAAGQQSPRTKSHSPTSGEVRMLQPDLACVGLSDDLGVDHWGLKIVKLVAFPDLIPPSRSATYSSYPSASTSSSKKPRRDSHTEDLLLRRPSADGDDDSASCSSSSSSESEDGYFSHSPQNVSTASLTSTNTSSRSASDLHALYAGSASGSNGTATGAAHKTPTPSKHFVAHVAPMSPIHPPVSSSAPPLSVLTSTATPKPTRPLVSSPTSLQHAPTSLSHTSSPSAPAPSAPSGVPFFSFTRTPEGSSLTADVNVLAALFPPHERHMVICGGELDAADARVRRRVEREGREGRRRGSGSGSWPDSEDELDLEGVEDGLGGRNGDEREGRSRRRRSESESSYDDADTDADGSRRGTGGGGGGGGALKALQIDLRRFGLDKHGLVNRFSRVLEENGINHMYSSTFKTANLLVDKSDAVRAQSLLRSC